MKAERRDTFLLLAPWLVGFIFLTSLPVLASMALSLTDTQGDASLGSTKWVGLSHYRTALAVDRSYPLTAEDPRLWRWLGGRPGDERFYRSLINSLYYALIAVPLNLIVSLAAALLLHRRRPGMSLLRALIYLPHVLGGAATIMIWSWIFNPRFGQLNQIIRWLYGKLEPILVALTGNGAAEAWTPDWLYSPQWCKPAVIIMYVWTMGGSMLIFLAALRRLPPMYHEAARLDGAGWWHRFRFVTWPQITPAVWFNLLCGLVFTMQAFNESYLLQNRSQQDGLLFYVRNLYEVAFEPPYRLGYASALAWILCLVLLVMVLPIVLTARRWVYDALSD